MGNVAFDQQNSIRVFINSYTHNPDVRNLQDIYDVSNAQYLSKGNPNLKSSYNHRVNFHYIRSNIEKERLLAKDKIVPASLQMMIIQWSKTWIGLNLSS